jgi:hypothetical protein
LNKYLKITGIINIVSRPQKILKKIGIKLYNTLALPAMLHGSETWTIKARDARRITTAEIKHMRITARYTWIDHKTNTEIAKELNIAILLDKIQSYKRNWIQHANRMPCNRFPSILKNYTPEGRRTRGRPMNRLLDK